MAVVTLAALKAYFETGDFPTQTEFENLIDSLGGGETYKRYVALLTQSGTNAPVATVLENTIGTISSAYITVGVYELTSSALFTSGKTVVCLSGHKDKIIYNSYVASASSVQFSTYNASATHAAENDWLSNAMIEIRVYS
jgi:hypothetical protein